MQFQSHFANLLFFLCIALKWCTILLIHAHASLSTIKHTRELTYFSLPPRLGLKYVHEIQTCEMKCYALRYLQVMTETVDCCKSKIFAS